MCLELDCGLCEMMVVTMWVVSSVLVEIVVWRTDSMVV